MNHAPASFSTCLVLLMFLWVMPSAAGEPPRINRALSSCSGFASADEIAATLEGLAQACPEVCLMVKLGRSVQGRPIIALLVGEDLDDPAQAIGLRVLGALHGDECLSAQTTLDLAAWLVESADTDPLAADWMRDAVTAFVPLVNPDGYAALPATRANASRVDLNRDFSFARLLDDGPAFSQPETRAIRALSELAAFQLGVELHTVERYVNAPWNHTPHHPPDEALLLRLMKDYVGSSGYSTTFGWDWYDIYGDVNDWSYGTAGTIDFAVELRSDLTSELVVHAEGLIALIDNAKTAIVGVVRDARTLDPLSARIELVPEGAPVFSTLPAGAYRRIVLPGQYAVTVHSPGYTSKTATVTVESGSEKILDFDLVAELDEPAWGFKVVGTVLPRPVPRVLTSSTYLDDSLAFDALGPADGVGYSLKPRGEATVDLGFMASTARARLRITSSTGSADRAAAFVAQERDGPFFALGEGAGDFELELDGCGWSWVRYVRVVDLTQGPFNAREPGYDLDAVAVLGTAAVPDTDGTAEPLRAISGAVCECTVGAEYGNRFSLIALLARVFS
ncbi:MAG: hypothetical protein MUC50_14725 [Myxococcota bacterium]|jgi:carboxypeptidase T|nr:hypothetical protein [Myxococcota bacterium]